MIQARRIGHATFETPDLDAAVVGEPVDDVVHAVDRAAGERLHVEWHLNSMPGDALVPPLVPDTAHPVAPWTQGSAACSCPMVAPG